MKNLIVAAVLLLILFAACNKGDGDDTPDPVEPTCRLSEISFSGGGNDSVLYTFQYTNGLLAGIATKQGGTTTTRSFQRAGNNIILVKPSTTNIVDSVFLNENGLIQRHRYRQFIASGVEEITEYAYNGTEVYRRAVTRYQNASPVQSDTTYYQWSRGNLFREIQGGVTTEYAYDTDRPVPAAGGDFFQLRTLLLQGAPVVKNQHFVSMMESPAGSNGSIVTYEFDEKGKVTKMSGEDGSYRFRYNCF